MKAIVCTFIFSGLSFLSGAQRSADLSVELVYPSTDPATFTMNTPYNIILKVKNQGSEAINAGDSLLLYITQNADTLEFLPGGENHIVKTGIDIPVGDSAQISHFMVYGDGTENSMVEACFSVIPVNAADPVTDPEISDNRSCVWIEVVENTAGINQLQTELIAVSPNPAKNSVTLSVVPDGEVRLLSPDGKEVKSLVPLGQTLDLSAVRNGMYLLNFTKDAQFISIRLVVEN
ncbi:T9SS type A sorting domain-containing protein [Crocinitomicaceae bacterium CZZ-1]|uniref:T9SS type A sorting domain-containing protein n=1 Tax=Taishania pollutisoli TaxID=2766479 RepID=A0A8J6PEV5_9FLAO|nr:T9SS type A sorting domain-containing protein [Taishania pollutisoli]MBC9812935.1 T9SS type A sorting domain-containing protein [Taishania pollutisoli]NGF76885.1 T9SS type A sorting domain-containing protein [Fluviicola sp. SGL-29]